VQQLFLTIRIRIRPNPKHRGAFETPEVILIHSGRIKTKCNASCLHGVCFTRINVFTATFARAFVVPASYEQKFRRPLAPKLKFHFTSSFIYHFTASFIYVIASRCVYSYPRLFYPFYSFVTVKHLFISFPTKGHMNRYSYN